MLCPIIDIRVPVNPIIEAGSQIEAGVSENVDLERDPYRSL